MFRKKKRFIRKRRYVKRRRFRRNKAPKLRTPRRQTRSTKYKTETFALPLIEVNAGYYQTAGDPPEFSMPIVPQVNIYKATFKKSNIDNQINGALQDQYNAFKIISAKVEWRLDCPNTSNYYMNETKTGSYVDTYHIPGANEVQLDEVLQAPYGRFHGARSGSRTYYPKVLKQSVMQYDTNIGTTETFETLVPENRWYRSTINSNCEWRGLQLILPGVGSIDQTTLGSAQATGRKQYIPKWQIRTYVKVAFSNYADYDKSQ